MSEAKKVARESEDALRRKEIELEELLTTKQEGSVQMALQAKEIELTKAMDKLLQVSYRLYMYMQIKFT